MRILVVEDDPALRLGVRRALQAEGWQVDVVADGEQAITATQFESYDAAVLDLGLPRRDGLLVLNAWRQQGQDLSVIVLTARDELSNRVEGLNLGADDYMSKPFESEELIARLRALARRRSGVSSPSTRLGPLMYTPATRELKCNGQQIALSARETALIELLMSMPEKTVTKSRIATSMSTWESEFSPNSIEIYIMRLRRKLLNSGVQIQTVRGVGYKIGLTNSNTPGVQE